MNTTFQTAAYEMIIAELSATVAIYSFRDHCPVAGWIWSVSAVVYVAAFILSLSTLWRTRHDRQKISATF